MKKNYLLDTNVLLHDPRALFNFEDNNIYLPLEVVVELDQFKKGSEEINANAREVIRNLEELTEKGVPDKGIALPREGRLYFLKSSVESWYSEVQQDDDSLLGKILVRLDRAVRIVENKLGYADDRILMMAQYLKET